MEHHHVDRVKCNRNGTTFSQSDFYVKSFAVALNLDLPMRFPPLWEPAWFVAIVTA